MSRLYSNNYFRTYFRRNTREVMIGDVGVGGNNPIRVQSMTIADTMDTGATVAEVIQLVEAGCEIVRITAPSINEAENLKNIKTELDRRNVHVPLVADIHFTPNAAMTAADYVEKVRINPGNYADKKKFEQREYTDDEYSDELDRLEEKFKPLVLKCKALGRAMRIGTNHGSLSDRIMNRYGDTPEGMVESALEFVRICEKYEYYDIILSMKSSNPQVAIHAYRLLAARMDEFGMDYPFHLGVTEAGDGLHGRIKSAVGIGSLLEDGIGDTIRVSLTEDAVKEVPVAFALVKKYNEQANKKHTANEEKIAVIKPGNAFEYQRRETLECNVIYHRLGAGNVPGVELNLNLDTGNSLKDALQTISTMLGNSDNDLLNITGQTNARDKLQVETIHVTLKDEAEFVRFQELRDDLAARNLFVAFAVDGSQISHRFYDICRIAERLVVSDSAISESTINAALNAASTFGKALEWRLEGTDQSIETGLTEILKHSEKHDYWNSIFSLRPPVEIAAYRYLAGRLNSLRATFPILLSFKTDENLQDTVLHAATFFGSLLCDGIGDAIYIESKLPVSKLLDLSYGILQATRTRISKTDYISCPSCGRTLFNLQTTTERIKSKTDHLKGVKIAIMGCIVNGPGEMADADFGYVGAGPGKINLFVGKECVERNIPEDKADERLMRLISDQGKWVDP